MERFRNTAAALGAGIALVLTLKSLAAQQNDLQRRIQEGVALIKLGCGRWRSLCRAQ